VNEPTSHSCGRLQREPLRSIGANFAVFVIHGTVAEVHLGCAAGHSTMIVTPPIIPAVSQESRSIFSTFMIFLYQKYLYYSFMTCIFSFDNYIKIFILIYILINFLGILRMMIAALAELKR
jgi:hypothetical protein